MMRFVELDEGYRSFWQNSLRESLDVYSKLVGGLFSCLICLYRQKIKGTGHHFMQDKAHVLCLSCTKARIRLQSSNTNRVSPVCQ